MLSRTALTCNHYAAGCTKTEPEILQVKRGQKQRNAPDSARKRRNRVRFGCWRGWQRLGTDKTRCEKPKFEPKRTPFPCTTCKKKPGRNTVFPPGLWQGQKDLNPRHAVLEWMWESAPGSEEGTVLSSSCRKSQNGRCWFGAAGKFCGRSSSQIATDTIRQSSRICWMSTADSSFFSARAAASFSKNSRLAEMISFTLR